MKACVALICLGLLLAGCTTTSKQLEAQLADTNRSQQDRARDADRLPVEVLAFLGVKPGMVALDVIAGGGYYTEVLSYAVGPSGKVYAQNPSWLLKIRNGAISKALGERLADKRLANVVRLNQPLIALDIEPESLDIAITALNFHDIIDKESPQAAAKALQAIKSLLKPGGVLGIIDHYGEPGQDNMKLHRLDVSIGLPIIEAAGFNIEKSRLLRNPKDDYSANVFKPGIRGKTDRLLVKLTKPMVNRADLGAKTTNKLTPAIHLGPKLLPRPLP